MASQFSLPLTPGGAVTAPSGSFTFIEPSAKTTTFLDIGPVNILEIPEFGFAMADGVNPMRFATRSAIYATGGIAPNVALTAAGTGNRATATQTFTTQPDNNDEYRIDGAGGYFITVKFVTTLTTTSDATFNYRVECLRGSDLAAAIANVAKIFNGTGVEGTDYHWRSTYLTYAQVIAGLKVVVSGTTGTVITYRATEYGTGGNSFTGTEITDGTGDWSITNFSGGTNSSGSVPGVGSYRYFYTWYRDADGAETGRSPITTYANGAVGNINISALTASPDTTFDFIRIYRTETLGVEFFLLGAVPRASSTFTDDISDTTLATSTTWNELLHRDYAEGAVPRGLALALWKESLWSLGAHLAAEYVRGTVAVVKGSATVTFSVKGVTALMALRTFQVAATSEEYTLISIDESARTAVLDRVYEGADAASASFTIIDDYDACALRRTPAFLYNQWPVDESPGRVDTDDARGGVALLATKSRLFAFSRTSIVAVTGDGPESWELSKVGQGVGCVGTRLVVGVEGGGMFLSFDGFYLISPDEQLVPVSSPKVRRGELARGIDGTVARINWACVDQGYSYYDPVERTVVFGLPLDSAIVPNYEIVFDVQNQTWTTFKRAEWTAAMNGTLPGGGQFILAGDRDGKLWHVDIGESDGFYGAEAVATLTSSQTVRLLTAAGASWTTTGDGEKGKPFVVLYADGVTTAYGKVASNTATTITPCEDLATAPAAGDQIVLGAIAWQAKSGGTTFGEEYRTKGVRSVTVRHAPTTRGEYFLSFSVDGGAFSLPPVGTGIGSLAEADGKVRHMTQWWGDSFALNLRGFKPGGRATIRGGVFDILTREVG